MALAANPKTGEILAVASKPDFDPNDYSKYNKMLEIIPRQQIPLNPVPLLNW